MSFTFRLRCDLFPSSRSVEIWIINHLPHLACQVVYDSNHTHTHVPTSQKKNVHLLHDVHFLILFRMTNFDLRKIPGILLWVQGDNYWPAVRKVGHNFWVEQFIWYPRYKFQLQNWSAACLSGIGGISVSYYVGPELVEERLSGSDSGNHQLAGTFPERSY